MKRFFSVFALMFFMVLSAPEAEAKKFGGGKSFGKSYKTAPAPKSQPAATDTIGKQNPAAAKPSSRGLMGGLLGGLLAGGLIASLLGGGFDGFQMMDFLIIGLIAFVLFKIFKALMAAKKSGAINRPDSAAYAGNLQGKAKENNVYQQQAERRDVSISAMGAAQMQGDVPLNYPPHFDGAAFIEGARNHYRILQEAWNKNQLDTILEYVTPTLYDELAKERGTLKGDQHTEVMYVDAQIVRADSTASKAELSLQFSGRYRDKQDGVEENITDIWHLERNMREDNSPWLIVGIDAK